jgi:two-component system sensor histidine kinase AlgZ
LILTRLGRYVDALPPVVRWAAIIVQILVFTVFGAALGVLAMQALGLARPDTFWRDYAMALRFGIVVALTVGVGFALWETRREELAEARRRIQEHELTEARALRQLAEARLASLEARLHPHFLFNTLNSIASLIHEDPRLAEDTVERLATLLRFTLDASENRLVDLALETRVVTDYLEIERARFGERLQFELHVPSEFASVLVPPLALQTLVENAVKHAVARQPAGAAITLTARLDGDSLEIRVEDDGPGFESDSLPPGHGLVNLRDRLHGIYGHLGTLEVGSREGGGAEVTIRLPLREGND